MDYREFDKILHRHGIKEAARRFAIISDLLAALGGRERVEFAIRAIAVERRVRNGEPLEVSISEIAKRVGLSYKQTVRHLHNWHDEGGIAYEYGGSGRGRLSRITLKVDMMSSFSSDKALRQ